MTFNILTLFPDTLRCFFHESIIKRAVERGVIALNIIDIRDYSTNKHRKVDDYPFGGGRGMVLCPEPLFGALEGIGERGWVVYLSPAGSLLKQRKVRELAQHKSITLICGHYEGIDHRVVEHFVDEQISVGDYILTGGEIAAAALVDSISREVDDALGNDESKREESFDATGLLEYEQYTRPASFRGYNVPEVLLSGNHREIAIWRLKRRLINTLKMRPDLLDEITLTREMKEILDEVTKETNHEHSTGN